MNNRILTSLIFLLSANSLFANVVGSDMQNFNPTSSGLEFVTVHPSATLAPWQLNMGTFLNFATNSLPYSTLATAPNSQGFASPKDILLYSNLHFALGILTGWEIGMAASFINYQYLQESIYLFNYGDKGINDIRFDTKVRLFNYNDFGLAVLSSLNLDQIKENPFTGHNAGPTFNIEGAADYRFTPNILWAVNIGYRLRQEGTTIQNKGVTPLSNQFIYSTALSYKTDEMGSAVIGELYGSVPMIEYTMPTDRQLSNLEVNLGYRYRGWKNLDIHGGMGSGIYRGIGSPDIRLYAGINWRVGFMEPNNTADIEPVPMPLSNESPNSEMPIETRDLLLYDSSGLPQQKAEEFQKMDADGDGVLDRDDRCPGSPPGMTVNALGCEVRSYGN